MADELNIPTHRYYQPRYNVALAVEDISKQYIYDSGIRKIDARIGEVEIREPLFALGEPGVWYDPSDVANTNWRRNLLTWTEQFNNAAWAKVGATTTANAVIAPDGTLTADAVTSTGSDPYVEQQISGSSVTHTLSVWLQGVGSTIGKKPRLILVRGSYVEVVGSALLSALTNQWQRYTFTGTFSAAPTSVLARIDVVNDTPASGDVVYIWGAQLEVGSVATEYQRITDVNTEVIERFPTATLYQDAAGTTPVTAPAQPVGLVLDKSQGLALGPELVTNGTFSDALNGWTSSPVGTGTATVVNGQAVLQFNTSANRGRITQQITTVSGRYYEVLLTVVSGTPNLFVGTTSTANDTFAANSVVAGSYRYLVAAGSSFWLTVVPNPSSTVAAVVDNISVRELPGFHATQSTAASRPTYGIVPSTGQRNLLTFTEQFDNAAWLKGNTSVSGFTVTTSSASHSLHQIVSVVPGQVYRFSFYAQRGTMSNVKYSVYNRTNNADIVAPTSYYSQINSSGLTRVSFSFTAPAGCVSVNVYPLRDSGVTGTVILGATSFGTQLETGSTATNYQRVGSAFDVTEAGVASLSYLSFDGVDDFLVTPTITPGIDKAQVFAGVRKLSDAVVGTVAETSLGVGGNNGSLQLAAPFSGANYTFQSRGTTQQAASYTDVSIAAPVTNVVTGVGDISGDRATLRVNGVQVAQNTVDQGTGNFLAYPLYIGRRGGTSLPFSGRIYSLITRFGANLTAAQISDTETWVNGKTGAY